MRYLLDTHILLWAANGTLAQKTNSEVARVISDENNEVFFSPINIWEIELKKDRLNESPEILYKNLLANGYKELELTSASVLNLGTLQSIHKDPFDRMLLAQAKSVGAVLISHDSEIIKYNENILVC